MIKKILIIILMVLITSPAYSAISRDQNEINQNLSASTSNAVTISSVSSGDLIVTCVAMDKSSGTITIPTDFTLLNEYVSASVSGATAYKISTGGETSVSWSWVNSKMNIAWVGVYSGLASSSVLDVKEENDSGASAVSSISSGTTAATAIASSVGISCAMNDSAGNMDDGRSFTNSYVEIAVHPTDVTGGPGMSISEKILSSTGTQETTFANTGGSDQMYHNIQVFKTTAAPTTSGVIFY